MLQHYVLRLATAPSPDYEMVAGDLREEYLRVTLALYLCRRKYYSLVRLVFLPAVNERMRARRLLRFLFPG